LSKYYLLRALGDISLTYNGTQQKQASNLASSYNPSPPVYYLLKELARQINGCIGQKYYQWKDEDGGKRPLLLLLLLLKQMEGEGEGDGCHQTQNGQLRPCRCSTKI
jgi:hypothetical protein